MLGIFTTIAHRWAQRRHRKQREIFRFFDGRRTRGADPMLILRSLTGSGEFNSERHYPAAIEGDAEAIAICCRGVCEAFGVKPFQEVDGQQEGLTEAECMALLVTFSEYLDALKKNTNGPPTWPESSTQEPSDESTTNCGSDSGSTADEVKCDAPASCSTP